MPDFLFRLDCILCVLLLRCSPWFEDEPFLNGLSLLPLVDALPLYDLSGTAKVAAIFPALRFFSRMASLTGDVWECTKIHEFFPNLTIFEDLLRSEVGKNVWKSAAVQSSLPS